MKILDYYDYIVNETSGIVKEIKKIRNPIIPNFISYHAKMNNPVCLPDYYDFNKRSTILAGGTSTNEVSALIKCLGESIERYVAYDINSNKFIIDSLNNLVKRGHICISVNDFALFSEEQYNVHGFPFKKIDNNTIIHWSESKCLNDDSEVLCPSDLIFLNRIEKFKIHYNISTGQACGETLEDALLTAIYESIERDSFIMTWKKRISFPIIDIDTINDSTIKKLINYFLERDLNINIVKVEMEYGIPTIMGVLFVHGKYCNVLVDTATKPTYKEAILSVLESLANLLLYNFKNYNKNTIVSDYNEVISLEDHNRIFKDKRRWNEFNFIKKGKKINYADLIKADSNNIDKDAEQLIKECVDKLFNCGIKSYYCDITTKYIKELGFYVVQAIVPELLSFEINNNYKYLGGRRLKIANHLFKDYDHIEGINDTPHPFL